MESSTGYARRVAVAGATGAVGSCIVSALLSSGRYEITVLVRNKTAFQTGFAGTVVEVDFESDQSLQSALKGQAVLISALGKTALALQPRLIEAAVSAGVQRIVPSEFGADLQNPKIRQFPTYRPKVLVEEQLERLQLVYGISYTLIYTNCFLDWGISSHEGLLLDPTSRTMHLYDGGDRKFSTTSIPTLAKAVVAVLDHYNETANRAVYVHDAVTTQNELLQIAKETTAGDGGKHWDVVHIDSADGEAKAYTALNEGKKEPSIFYAFAARSIFGEGYGGHFSHTDNALLGIKEMTSDQLREVVRHCVLLEDVNPSRFAEFSPSTTVIAKPPPAQSVQSVPQPQ